MSPNEPDPILRPMRYLLPTRKSMLRCMCYRLKLVLYWNLECRIAARMEGRPLGCTRWSLSRVKERKEERKKSKWGDKMCERKRCSLSGSATKRVRLNCWSVHAKLSQSSNLSYQILFLNLESNTKVTFGSMLFMHLLVIVLIDLKNMLDTPVIDIKLLQMGL